MENENNRIFPIMEQKIFPFLLENGIEPIIISGSLQETLEIYKKRMGFQRVKAIRYRIKDGKYTEDCILNTAIGSGKQVIVDEIIKEQDTKILFAFGDSEADIPLLVSATQSFINSEKKFLQGNVHYFDFKREQAGNQIIELMTQTMRIQKICTKENLNKY